MPEITEYKEGDKIKCNKDFSNLGISYDKGDELEIIIYSEDDEDICDVQFLPSGAIVTMDKDCLKNFSKF